MTLSIAFLTASEAYEVILETVAVTFVVNSVVVLEILLATSVALFKRFEAV